MKALRNQALIKSINRAQVLNAIRLNSPIARSQIAGLTGLDRKSLTKFVSEFISEGLVEEFACARSKGSGRPFKMLRFKRLLAMGIEIMTGHVSGVMVDLYGKVHASHVIEDGRLERSPERLLKAVRDVYGRLKESAGAPVGVGVAVQGVIDSSQGIVLESVNIPSAKMNLKAELRRFVKEKVFVERSSVAVALAEKWFGAGRLHEDFICVELSSGVGAGIIVGRRAFRGAGTHAGELGHLVIEEGGEPCRCGKRGCLEAYVSERRIFEEAGRLLAIPPGRLEDPGTFETWRGSPLEPLIKDMGRRLGWGVAAMANLFNPKIVILEGRLLDAFGVALLPAVKDGVAERTLPLCMKDLKIVASSLRDPIARGAAAQVISDMIEVEGHYCV